ncbi:MAG: ShlB/FhaC/HecB family hemolysin secretion/activation protein [Chlamydiales bacterium]|nr:ShlB/FhaC/HecB family hemolysin secretion/activation protein [Chlamydiales bacterium]
MEMPEAEDQEILPCLSSITLVGKQSSLSKMPPKGEGVFLKDLDIPGREENLTRELAKRFLNRPLTEKNLHQIKECILDYYRHRDHPIVLVQIPEQEITASSLQVLVLESSMGKVNPIGNKHFKTSRLKKQIRQKEGEPISVQRLNKDLTWINRNPFIRADAIFSPGETKGTTDIDLIIEDKWPYRVYAGIDNTGVPTTGHNRYYAGINFGNLWNIGHQFNYQFTTATTYKDFWAHTGQYLIPLPWRHIWQFYGGYSHVEAPIRSQNNPTPFKTQGFSWQVSTRYALPLPSCAHFLNEINAGFDFKRTNNNINLDQPGISSGTEFIFGGGANIGQFMLGYNCGYERQNWKFNLTLENFYQPGAIGFADQSNQDYNQLREFAKNHYFYLRGQLFPIFRFPKIGIFWYLNLRGQYANENLLSSEQMTVGGYDTVRGYEERQLNGDSAILFSTELRSPIWSFFRIRKKEQDAFQLLGFYDYGTAYIHKPAAGEPKHQTIQSIGPGARYRFNQYLTARIDLGFRLQKVEGLKFDHHHKWHFAVTGSY